MNNTELIALRTENANLRADIEVMRVDAEIIETKIKRIDALEAQVAALTGLLEQCLPFISMPLTREVVASIASQKATS